jgi:hypothetical protein
VRPQMLQNGQSVSLKRTDNSDYPWRAEVEMGTAVCRIETSLV